MSRIEIDKHLEAIALINSSLGQDSSKRERLIARVKISAEYEAIKLLDIDFYNTCTRNGRDKS